MVIIQYMYTVRGNIVRADLERVYAHVQTIPILSMYDHKLR